MALTPDQTKELRDMLKEIESLSSKLKANIDTTGLQDLETNASAIKRLFKDLKEEWNELTSDISVAANGFREVVKEISRQNVGLNDSIKAYKGLTSIADKIQAYQKGYSNLSFKDIAKLKEQTKLEKQRIANAQNLLKEKKLEYESSLSINKDSIDAKQAEIALLATKAGKTKQDYYDLQKLRNEVKNLNKDYTKVNTELSRTTDALTQNTALLNDQDEAFKNLSLSIEKVALESINDLDKSFKDMINDVSTIDQIVKNMSKTFDNLSGISQKIQEYQENIADVSKEDVEELVKKVKLEQQRLTHNLQLLDLEKQRLEASSTANKEDLLNAEARMNALQSLGVLTERETAELTELETKKKGLLDIESEIAHKLEANNKLTEKNKEYVEGNNEEFQKLLGTLDEVENGVKNINKSFGLNIGKNLKGALGKGGLGRLADSLGIDDATKKMSKLTAQYTNNGKTALTLGQQFKVMGGGLSSMGGNLLKGFNPMMLALTGIVKLVQFFIEAMFEADQQVIDVAKSLNISKDAAREVRDRFFEISDNAKTYAGLLDNQVLSQKELVAANLKINELLGVSVDFSSQLGDKGKILVAQFAAISKFLKLSEEEQKGLLDLQATSGKEVNDIRNSVLGTTSLYKIQTGVLLNERKVLENVLKASNAIKLSTKGGVEGLTKSAIEAAKLGLSLQKVSDIAGGLLDFESQIAAELEAELITGKDLNLELAQQAALNNDLATVASEISKNIGSAAEYSKMNRLEQESLAKAVGMTSNELADVLTTQEQLNKLKGTFNALGADQLELMKKSGKVDAKTIELLSTGKATVVDYYKALKEAGKTQEEITALLGEQSYASLSAQTAQEKFNESLEKAKEIFSRFVDGGSLDKLADFITRFVTSVDEKGLLGTITGGMMSKGEVEALQTQKQIKSIDKQIEEKKAKGEDVSQLEEQRKGLTPTLAKQQYLASTEYEGSFAAQDLMKLNPLEQMMGDKTLQEKAAGENTIFEDYRKWIDDNILGSTLGITEQLKREQEEAKIQLKKVEEEYDAKNPPATQGQDLVVQMQDGVVKKNKGLKENGGLVISKFNQGELQPIAQGIKQDQAFALSTNDAVSSSSMTGASSTNTTTTSNLNTVNTLNKTDLTNLVDNVKKTSLDENITKNTVDITSELANIVNSQQTSTSTTSDIVKNIVTITDKLSSISTSLETISKSSQSKLNTSNSTTTNALTGAAEGLEKGGLLGGFMGAIRGAFFNLESAKAQTTKSADTPPPSEETVKVPSPLFLPQFLTPEASTFNNTNKSSTAATNITSNTTTTNTDNPAVIAAINKLADVIISNSSKEIVMQMNGQTVGKVLTPIMTPGIVRQINNSVVLT